MINRNDIMEAELYLLNSLRNISIPLMSPLIILYNQKLYQQLVY